ncbi:metaphase-anaphase transition protein [Grosmannia clavigera kw1407]|uniref:Metaphase-anaphase transition protein n=1 Tax=Grosmannia clavigera (strain kw1407 / UAMH 11150) TaxID=655863 RepID=F0XGL2_GROCL|nr:metaphase-anaphase transition protein [Grosmannia clavigera kw1407]EFX03090.1 metaphase-anaphase transition protein [Grosmannia clavigera kw1407]
MDSQTAHDGSAEVVDAVLQQQAPPTARRQSSSQESEDSQTAADFIRSQMQLEADAREALPYSIETCTKPLGRLRQNVFACLTCNPPPDNPDQAYEKPAGICYACSVQCHGEHKLVEIFTKRNFTCDCGTTRFPDTSPCTLRINEETNTKGNVHSEVPDAGNKYNHNFRNRFCGCACDYDPFEQKGTMYQCLGLGTHETGGCGEDWWHPGCVVGLGPKWFEDVATAKEDEKSVAVPTSSANALPTISEDDVEGAQNDGTETAAAAEDGEGGEDDDPPLPAGFPKEEEFEGFICYKCVEAYPWIKRYAGAPGFLPAVFLRETTTDLPVSRKRKAEDEADEGLADGTTAQEPKRIRSDDQAKSGPVGGEEHKTQSETARMLACKFQVLPPAPATGRFSLFFTESFRDQLCRCADCFPKLRPHAQLLEEEETYEPPVSDDGSADGGDGGSANGRNSGGGPSQGSGSLYDRGESALQNIDRVRAIEGVMAYNQLKDKLKPFFQQFAESGQAISAEDIKSYFAKLRGDEQAIREAGEAAKSADHRQEQSGY